MKSRKNAYTVIRPKAAMGALLLTALFFVTAVAAESDERGAELDGRTVYQLLLGEIALQRGEKEVAAQAYAEVAKRSKDKVVLSRALQVAVTTQKMDLALDLGRLWVEVDPSSLTARHALVGVLAGLGRHDELLPHLAFMLEKDDGARPRNVLHLPRWFAWQADRVVVLANVDTLLAPYLALPEAHYVLAGAARLAGNRERALQSIAEALRLRPVWLQAVLFEAQTLSETSLPLAIDSLSRYLKLNPDDLDALTLRGRYLASEQRFAAARVDLEKVLKSNPESMDALYPLALVALQQKDFQSAEKALLSLSGREFSGRSLVFYQLGVLAEERNDLAVASDFYMRVGAGEYFVAAKVRLAQLMSRQGKSAEAREFLRQLETTYPEMKPEERSRLIMAEAYLLREEKQFEAAFSLLEKALKLQPNEPDLLYDQAMLAERLNKMEVLESNLSRVIVLRPDNAQAYNALGYSLAERNLRLGEAQQLVSKALQLAPEDPFILDSMGWVLFRLGRVDEALLHLEHAYRLRQDPEIAAHVGEVLWVLNRREDALKIWREARKMHPENEVLGTVIERFANVSPAH